MRERRKAHKVKRAPRTHGCPHGSSSCTVCPWRMGGGALDSRSQRCVCVSMCRVCLAWGNRLLIPTSSCMRHLYLYLPVKVCTTTPVWCYSYRDSSHQSHTGYSCTHSDTDARTGRRASRDAPTARRPLSPTVTCGYADGYGWLRMVPLVPHGPTGGQNLPEVASR